MLVSISLFFLHSFEICRFQVLKEKRKRFFFQYVKSIFCLYTLLGLVIKQVHISGTNFKFRSLQK